MRSSHLFTRTSKSVAHDADSMNAKYLTQGGFIHQEMAGVYSFLPLGLRVLRNIQQIVREEMDAIGGQEILMSALTPKDVWVTTNRWENFDALFRFEGSGDKEYALGATHEEIVTPLVQHYTFSYKDLPVAVYQIQNKFRNEPRAKSGLLRGREFNMKDLYSFHKTQEDLDAYYEKAKAAYLKVFKRLGFDPKKTYYTYASGGAFCKYSHEFQYATEVGEDTIYCCDHCTVAVNKEILADQKTCPQCGNEKLTEKRAVEIGNIFKLGTRFSEAFKFQVADENDKKTSVIMGCYGIGPSRIMGTLVEVFNDEGGILWPKAVAPMQVHLVSIARNPETVKAADALYEDLKAAGISVLFDDRDQSPGAKFKDADLIGIPLRIVISDRTLEAGEVEWKERASKDAVRIKTAEVLKKVAEFYKSL
jgi:prolyl-tRNA synthetase